MVLVPIIHVYYYVYAFINIFNFHVRWNDMSSSVIYHASFMKSLIIKAVLALQNLHATESQQKLTEPCCRNKGGNEMRWSELRRIF